MINMDHSILNPKDKRSPQHITLPEKEAALRHAINYLHNNYQHISPQFLPVNRSQCHSSQPGECSSSRGKPHSVNHNTKTR